MNSNSRYDRDLNNSVSNSMVQNSRHESWNNLNCSDVLIRKNNQSRYKESEVRDQGKNNQKVEASMDGYGGSAQGYPLQANSSHGNRAIRKSGGRGKPRVSSRATLGKLHGKPVPSGSGTVHVETLLLSSAHGSNTQSLRSQVEASNSGPPESKTPLVTAQSKSQEKGRPTDPSNQEKEFQSIEADDSELRKLLVDVVDKRERAQQEESRIRGILFARGKVEELTKDLEAEKLKRSEAEAKSEESLSLLRGSQERVKDLEEKVQNMEEELVLSRDEGEKRLCSLQSQLHENLQELETLRTEREQLLADNQAKAAECDSKEGELMDEIESLKMERSSSAEQIQALQTQVQALQAAQWQKEEHLRWMALQGQSLSQSPSDSSAVQELAASLHDRTERYNLLLRAHREQSSRFSEDERYKTQLIQQLQLDNEDLRGRLRKAESEGGWTCSSQAVQFVLSADIPKEQSGPIKGQVAFPNSLPAPGLPLQQDLTQNPSKGSEITEWLDNYEPESGIEADSSRVQGQDVMKFEGSLSSSALGQGSRPSADRTEDHGGREADPEAEKLEILGLLGGIVRTMPDEPQVWSKIDSVANRLARILHPRAWGDFSLKYGNLSDFLGSYPDFFTVMEGDSVCMKEGARAKVATLRASLQYSSTCRRTSGAFC